MPIEKASVPVAVRLLSVVLGVVALPMIAGGAWLVLLHGSPYYVLAGIALGVSAVLMWMGRPQAASVYGGLLLATVVWSLFEVGVDGWALMPRLVALTVIGIAFLVPGVPGALTRRRYGRALALLAVAIVIGSALHLLAPEPVDPIEQAGWGAFPRVANVSAAGGAADWSVYGGDAAGTRFSRLGEITPQNVSRLQVAWTYRTGITGTELTPLKIGDTLYICIGGRKIAALDAQSGRERWRFAITAPDDLSKTCRGVAFYRVPGGVGMCAERVMGVLVSNDLVALDARTGTPCRDFGTGGKVALTDGLSTSPSNYYGLHSPPAIIRGNVVVGSRIADGQYWGEPSGVVRAYDAVTGKLAWAFDVGRLDRRGPPEAGQTYTRSTPNVWGVISADEQLGLVYLPTGNSTPDYFGGRRRPFDDRYSSGVVALDGATGAVRWVFQTTHHDIWDYDVPSQPTLVDLGPNGAVKALVQGTKRGEVFVLDRATGQPVAPVVERPVPTAGAVKEERVSSTQPFSEHLPSFRGPRLEERAMWGATPLDQLWCRIKFRQARYDGTMTPIGLTPSIAHPGYTGGMNWGGVTVDTDHGVMIVNTNRVVNYNRLLTRRDADRAGIMPIGAPKSSMKVTYGAHAQAGTPYAADISSFVSFTGAPCQAPPYGKLSAVDLNTGKLVWSRDFGTAEGSGLFGVPSHLPFTLGTPNVGGGITTRSGLLFIGATTDSYLRAISVADGRELWRSRLPGGGQATPMTYTAGPRGRQFVVMYAGGHRYLRTPLNDALIAYSLPANR